MSPKDVILTLGWFALVYLVGGAIGGLLALRRTRKTCGPPPQLRKPEPEPQQRYNHMRFIGGVIWCGKVEKRLHLGDQHVYGDAFTCPGCGQHVVARIKYHSDDLRRRP